MNVLVFTLCDYHSNRASELPIRFHFPFPHKRIRDHDVLALGDRCLYLGKTPGMRSLNFGRIVDIRSVLFEKHVCFNMDM